MNLKKVTGCAMGTGLVLLGVVQTANAIELLNGFGGARGYGTEFLGRNDDGSTNQISLPFEVNFFGNTYSSFFVNNNGNVTFNNPLSSYTPNPFPIAGQPMIAPFWADVDTRNNPGDDSNLVWVNSPNEDTVVVTWDQVGYYGGHIDLRNDFQLVLRNRGNGNFDADFRYNQLQWTTGDASGGTSGLGGTPAQAGFDAGNLTDYFALPGSFTGEVLNLANTSNFSIDTPGLWTFSFLDGTPPDGSTPDNPLLPIATQEGWDFEFFIVENQPIFIDPIVAVGYDYIVNSGPNFASVTLPSIGDDLFNLSLWNGVDWVLEDVLSTGVPFSFGSSGVDRFRIDGIETTAGLDPNDPLAFVTQLTFVDSGVVDMSMNPITQQVNVPEPASLALLGIGLVGLGFARRRMRS